MYAKTKFPAVNSLYINPMFILFLQCYVTYHAFLSVVNTCSVSIVLFHSLSILRTNSSLLSPQPPYCFLQQGFLFAFIHTCKTLFRSTCNCTITNAVSASTIITTTPKSFLSQSIPTYDSLIILQIDVTRYEILKMLHICRTKAQIFHISK